MRRTKRDIGPWSLRQRLGLTFAGLLVIFSGLGTLLKGQLHYPNYWGGAVFAPFALLIGGLLIFIAIIQGRRS